MKKNLYGGIKTVQSIGHAAGAAATKVVRKNLYGTRPQITSSASTALGQETAIGSSLHSVFDGPKVRKRGAPALKRERSA